MLTLHKGEVTVTLAGAEHTLRPTLDAFATIAGLGPYLGTLRKLGEMDVPTMILVLRLGLGWPEARSREVTKLVFETGVHPLNQRLRDFVFAMFNAGKSAEDVLAEQEIRDEGNAPAGA